MKAMIEFLSLYMVLFLGAGVNRQIVINTKTQTIRSQFAGVNNSERASYSVDHEFNVADNRL